MFGRRDFIRSGVALVTLGAAEAIPSIFARATALAAADRSAVRGRTLVIVQLAGGNDGLNTLVPYEDGHYHGARPRLALKPDGVLRLDERVGLHPKLAGLGALWDAGALAIVEGVGYPNPDLSHFKSMAIWRAASPEGTTTQGWAGRYLDSLERAEHHPFLGFNVGSAVPPDLQARTAGVPAVQNVSDYRLMPPGGDEAAAQRREGALLKLYRAYPANGPYAALLETTAERAVDSARALQQAHAGYRPAVHYPQTSLGSGLQLLAEVIASGQEIRVGNVSLGGFDTHGAQVGEHERLLATVGDALHAFWQALAAHGKADDVLIMTWSEFGRRVQENASGGTDHGTAAPMFLIGGAVKGGLYGEPPGLAALDDGNLRHTTDFRAVYATVLERWLGADSAALLGRRFPLLGFV